MSKDLNDVLNVCVPVTLHGHFYKGVVIHGGVTMEFVGTCNPDSKALKFGNCSAEISERVQPMCSAISNAETAQWNEAASGFLHIEPLTPWTPPA